MKCIVSGCEIPARGDLKSDLFMTPWWACGVHRRALADLINEAQKEYRKKRELAHKAASDIMNEGLDAMGNHIAERDLQYPLSLAT